jgi:hypothetical protein
VAAGKAPAGEFFHNRNAWRAPVTFSFFLCKLELELRPTIVHADIVKKREAHVAALLALSQPVA